MLNILVDMLNKKLGMSTEIKEVRAEYGYLEAISIMISYKR